MDSLTQATLGAVVGELVLGRKLGRRGMVWGAFFGTLPDLDILLFPWADVVDQLRLHRGVSHSVLLMVLAPLLLAPLLGWLWRKKEVSRQRAAAFVFLVWSTHVLIDVFTVYGTQIWEPFSSVRVRTDTLFIIDPLFTLPMLLGLLVTFWNRRRRSFHPRPGRATWIGLALTLLYTGWSFGARALITQRVQPDLAALPARVQRHFAAPTPFNTLLWRVLAETREAFYIGYRSVLDDPDVAVRWTEIPKKRPPLDGVDPRALEATQWFSEDWWIARSTPEGLYVADLRLSAIPVPGQDPSGAPAMAFVFGWLIPNHEDAPPLIAVRPDRSNAGEQLGEVLRRARGDLQALPPPAALRIPGQADEPLRILP